MDGQGLQRICLDTDASIAIINELPIASNILRAVSGRKVAITSITVFELYLRKTNLEVVDDFVISNKVLIFDTEAAKIGSLIEKDLSRKGKKTEIRDLFIAATAIANNCELLTLNRKDFEGIEGLRLTDLPGS